MREACEVEEREGECGCGGESRCRAVSMKRGGSDVSVSLPRCAEVCEEGGCSVFMTCQRDDQ